MQRETGHKALESKSGRGCLPLPVVFILIILFDLHGQNYRPIGGFLEGVYDADDSRMLVYDSDNDGNPELYYHTVKFPGKYFARIREYRDFNRYVGVDTLYEKIPQYIGNLDNDMKPDLLATGSRISYLYVFEPIFPEPYPTGLVWQSESTCYLRGRHVADLDKDGMMDILFGFSGLAFVYENSGDNQYELVWQHREIDHEKFTSGDFDKDGRIEFVTSPYDHTIVYECVGDNDYQVVYVDTTLNGCGRDILYGDDLDQDGKPEFVVGYHSGIGGNWAYYFQVFEAIGDNDYVVSFTSDTVYRPFSLTIGSCSHCGDVDLDGRDEIVWAVQDNWFIYKAFGNNDFRRVFTAYSQNYEWLSTAITIHDLNNNGYPEIIESCSNLLDNQNARNQTTIWEIEAVRLTYPNGGEVFHPNDTVDVTWQTFDPPGCDSLSLFFSVDSGYNYDTIVTGIPNSDTTYQWIVPDTVSNKCFLMIWAYGPGVGWDFTDSIFAVRKIGISEDTLKHPDKTIKIYPNPAHRRVHLDLPEDAGDINLFDATGRSIRKIRPAPKIVLDLPPGVYFLQVKIGTRVRTEKVIILR